MVLLYHLCDNYNCFGHSVSICTIRECFFSFDTPEAAYNYYTFGNTDVKLVVSGKCCDLVIGDKQNSDLYLIVPKTKDGWKVGIGADTTKIIQRIIGNIVVYVYQYKDTDDYFVTVFDTSGGTLEIEDSCNSNFLNLARKNNSTDKTFVSYHTSVVSLDNEYLLNINGTDISVAGHGDGSFVS